MALSWNEIKDRALNFSKEWAETVNEEADAKQFLVAFFNVFGIGNRRVSSFEHRVKKSDDRDGFIDLLWRGMMLIEMKSKGKNLDKAFQQAKDYLPGLKQHELPKYILVCDFENFRLHDMENGKIVAFKLSDFVNHVAHFGFIAGYEKKTYKEQDPANIEAANLMAKLHDRLEAIGYNGHALEVYLVRVLFCLFAEDTTIFNIQQFQEFIEQRTNEDGSDLASKLQELFQVLNTPKEKRYKNLDEQLADFPYVNGKLFEEILPVASFDSKMRTALLECCYIDWSKISPAIFGSMFQGVMNKTERRNLGAHYTSEQNILKLIKPLFLDDLHREFEKLRANVRETSKVSRTSSPLQEFHRRIAGLKFLDPACGCGNFLVITYRELRLLELEILRALNKSGQLVLNVAEIIYLDVDMMYGIEYEEFPARIAEVAMWLIDHQMNMLISAEFGQYFVRLPLIKAAKIVHGNALQIDWRSLIKSDAIDITANVTNVFTAQEPIAHYGTVNIFSKQINVMGTDAMLASHTFSGATTFDFILGNPPFIGTGMQNASQKADMEKVFANSASAGVLDYVSAWYLKAAQLIQNTKTQVAFVSTNSITQGEQVGVLWNILLNLYNIKIRFAHRTFSWTNEASGKAAVHCVIIGFANFDTPDKIIYEYDNIKGEPHAVSVKNINPYLVDAKDILMDKRSTPICNVPKMYKGSQPTDGGNFLFTEDEKNEFLKIEPKAEKFIKPFISAHEFINGIKRFCLWLVDAQPNELKQMPQVLKRIEAVRQERLKSTKEATIQWASKPTLFTENRQPASEYVVVPSVSSEKRKYIPIGFMSPDVIASNLCLIIPDAKLYHFGILTSEMHTAWMKNVCGRLESRFRYSNTIVYNNYPWPDAPTEKQTTAIENAAQKVLDVRLQFPSASLADLYDPLTMPPALVKAHNDLDKAVDAAYRAQPFTTEAKRMEFLFELYERYTADLFTATAKKKTKK